VNKRVGVLAGILALAGLGCGRAVTVENANSVIKVCQTPVQVIRKEFGPPDSIGMVAGMVTNEWRGFSSGQRMIVAFVNDIAVDVAIVPGNTVVEVKNSCAQ
jgi:hypothetical protein